MKRCSICGGPAPFTADDSSHDDCRSPRVGDQVRVRSFGGLRPDLVGRVTRIRHFDDGTSVTVQTNDRKWVYSVYADAPELSDRIEVMP